MTKYNHSKIEAKWQKYWQTHKTFLAKDFSKKPKKYILTEFPYPSGEGLHMGHLRPYVAGDVYSRFSRLKGHEVIFPMGWDAFGLPAENYAIKTGVNPSITTKRNIVNAKRQMLSWGLSFDWSREVNTTDPNYYKWTQWLFLQFFKQGLAYEATGLINWCPKDKTGLANEEVIDGKCERWRYAGRKKRIAPVVFKNNRLRRKVARRIESSSGLAGSC
jgi:leucyl-tRNA synthetase